MAETDVPALPRLPADFALQPFQRKMFQGLTQAADVLLVSGIGMGMDRLMLALLSLYCDPHMLVIVLNMAPEEQNLLVESLTQFIPEHPPHVLTNEQPAGERQRIYLGGGVVFVTSRIFVVDLLMERLPLTAISGLVVTNAHRVTRLSTEAFIIRLYRHANRTGFVKALTDHAQGFVGGFNAVEKGMRALWVSKLSIWPFFEKSLLREIEAVQPLTYEVQVDMTDRMQRVQQAVFDIMTSCLRTLKHLRPSLDLNQLTIERNLFKSFEHNLRKQLDSDWHTLDPKVRQLVHELRILRNVVTHLDQYDCVSFYHLLQTLRSNTRAFNQNSHWQMLDATNDLFEHAKYRVFPPPPASTTAPPGTADSRAAPRSGAATGSTATPAGRQRSTTDAGAGVSASTAAAAAGVGGYAIETNPKWEALNKVLASIRAERASTKTKTKAKGQTAAARSDAADTIPDAIAPAQIVVCVRDTRTASQLSQYLLQGSQAVLQAQLRRYLRWKGDFNALSARGLFSRGRSDVAGGGGSSSSSTTAGVGGSSRHAGGSRRARGKRRREAHMPLAVVDEEEQAALAAGAGNPRANTNGNANGAEGSLDGFGAEGFEEDEDDSQGSAVARDDHVLLPADEELERYFGEAGPDDVILVAMQSDELSATGHAAQFARLLKDVQPEHVVFYDPYLPCVRELQLYQAAHAAQRIRVYMMVYKGSFQEQQFLSSIRHEKEAFQHIIQAKRVMAFPVDQDGRQGLRQQQERQLARRPEEDNVSTRRAGGRALGGPQAHPRVIVDMREFRSSLPGILHEFGMDVEPRTLLVGDYILSPEVCVERKSLADLIGSLASGRLYTQAESMTRYYRRSALLIEFDEDKPFSLLDSRDRLAADIDFRNTMSKLALLTISFPKLRLLWSRSPHMTARLFDALKQHQVEPQGEAAAAIGVEASTGAAEYASEPQALLRQLPGVTSHNIFMIMEKVTCLRDLVELSLPELQRLCGRRHGGALFAFLNNLPEDVEEDKRAGEPQAKRAAPG